jgi:hypothetical protein
MTSGISPTELAALFTRIERELAQHGDSRSVLTFLTHKALQVIPGAQDAGVTRGEKGNFETIGATSDLVSSVDAIQYKLGSGPCVDAAIESSIFNAPDLRTDPRWPEFGSMAFTTSGVVSMLSFRLFVETDPDLIAALNLYSTEVAAFDESSEAIGLLLATHGALAVVGAEAQDKVANLMIALRNSREIGIAIGILMNQRKITRDQAFDVLRVTSQRAQRKLADIAAQVADTGQVPG